MSETLVLEYKVLIMRKGTLTLISAIFALFLVTGSVVAEDEAVEDESNVIIDVI